MRVVLASESYLPYLSGVTVSVDALARGLGALGHEVLLIAPRLGESRELESVGSPGPEPRYAWLDGYQLPRVAPPGYRMPWPNPWAAAWRTARDFRPDVVHAHSPFVTGLLARRLARDVGAPLVFTHHTRFADYGHYLGPLARPGSALTDAYLRRFWAGCAAIVAPSSDLADEIASRLGSGARPRIAVIPTGVDVAGIQALAPIDPRPEAGWPADSVVIGMLGRLAPEKSPIVVLDATAAVVSREDRTRLLVIGGGPAEADVRARADLPDLAGRVHVAGALPRPEALARLAGSDLFAFASRTETQGLVLAESLAAGVPVVAIDGPGVRDSVRDAIDGLIVPPEPAAGRAERLSEALAGLVADGEARREMADHARSDADRFAVARRSTETEELYRACIRSTRR